MVVQDWEGKYSAESFALSAFLRSFATESEKDSLRQRSVMLQTCGWKRRKFSKQELNKAGEQNGFHALRGAVLHFLYSGFPTTSIRNWQRQSRASAVW